MPLVGRARGSTRNRSSGACWQVQAIQPAHPDVIAIDGTTHRRSHDRPNGKAALHLLSARTAENRLALGQTAMNDTSIEITTIPQLLDLLDLRGSTIMIAAMERRR
jgi:putative N-acetylmannosamine-6-phosphate epimerase